MRQVIYQNQKELKKQISEVYLEAFPEEERPPVHYFFKCLERKENELVAYFDDETFIGFTFITRYQDICYILFLAVKKEYRHQGYGGQILEIIKRNNKENVILIFYEEVNPQYSNYEERVKREQFYLSHGFIDNNLKTNEYDVIYQSVYLGKHQVDYQTYFIIFELAFGLGRGKGLKQVQ